MSKRPYEYDLVVLSAGSDENEILKTLIEKRGESLGIPSLQCTFLKHPRKDPGCLLGSPEILQSYVDRAAYALVVFDWEGSGQEYRTASELEEEVEEALAGSGWDERCAVVVIAPELEIWLWIESPHVSKAFGWGSDYAGLVAALRRRHFVFTETGKPERPKEAIEACLREKRIQRSSSLYRAIAERVGLRHCADRSFLKLRTMISRWFGSDH